MAAIKPIIAKSVKAATGARSVSVGNVMGLLGYKGKVPRSGKRKVTDTKAYSFAPNTLRQAPAPRRARDVQRAAKARDEYKALRRRAQRYVREAEGRIGASSAYKGARSDAIRQLRDVLQETDISSAQWASDIRKSIAPLRAQLAQTQQAVRDVGRGGKRAMLEQMRLASSGSASTLGQYGQAKVKVFWSATIDLWQGQPDRVAAVVEGLGAANLEDAYLYVMEQQGEALAMMDAELGEGTLLDEILSTEAAEYYDAEGGADDAAGYPSYMYAVAAVSRPDERMA